MAKNQAVTYLHPEAGRSISSSAFGCWGRKSLIDFIDGYPDAELRTAKNGQFVKISGAICLEIKLKVSMHCQKCRTEVMKAVTKLTGVDQLSVDLEKEMFVVIGDVDPVCVATCLRKKKRAADIVSVGPLKSEESGVAKKDVLEPNQTAKVIYSYAPYDSGYQQIVYGYPPCYEYWRL